MTAPIGADTLEKLKARIQALRAMTTVNGCTEDEAMAAAAKVAELLDRYSLALTDVEIAASACEQRVYETGRRKRIPLEDCVASIARFCDARVWREKPEGGDVRYVFFGLPPDVEVAHYLCDLVDSAVRHELGRYKQGPSYARIPHNQRHLANGSFTLGMVTSIAARLDAMKAERDQAGENAARSLVVVKANVVDAELEKLGLQLRRSRRPVRYVHPDAYEAGDAAGAAIEINPALRQD